MPTNDKVMDVKKPGSARPDSSSRPVIVGHRPMVADPMVNKPDDKPKTDHDIKSPSESHKKLEPISDNPADTKPGSTDTKPEAEDTSQQAEEQESTEKAETSEEGAEKPKTDEKSKAKANEEAEKAEAEHQAKVQELVDSKKYYLDITSSTAAGFRTFLITVLVVLLIGLVALVALIDAEIIDLGIGLPFDLIK